MALKTKIIVQQILNIDDTTTTASKYPKYTVVLGNSISSITAGELTAAVEASAGSAAAAKGSEIAAKESELNAKDSENEAAISAGASEESASQSAASAAESERQAGLSKGSADNSAASAQESEGFRDSAELAAQNAEQSRLLAEQAKTAAQQAQTAAEAAKTGAETAKDGADAAATTAGEHAAAARQSELNAKISETNAAGSATEAGDKAIDATTEADRAKAEADRATQIVDSKLDKVDISGFIKVYKTKAEADADVVNRVLDEKVLVWNQTNSKYGWYKVAGTAETPVLELVETEQKLTSVNNVRADDAGNVQITLPGGNPSLWLGEVTWFPYDKDSGVGYPGVLPADGREVLRVDYPDTWEAIEAGLIPSVSEAEWQAGASLYFSTGDGSTTFRLPDMMQGQAFRAPTKGEEDAGVIKDQIPYVVTVNGISPDAITGNVEIDTSLQGTVSINQGGTGATTKEDARIALELYSTTEVDSALADKADIATTYTKTEVDSALADKADIATTYTKVEVDSALADAKTQSDTDYLLKANNLSDLADRAAAWLNVRPIGSTPLAGDPVGDYDAVTKRWVENKINTGTVGPTMNGVMNYGVGDFHLRDSRAYIQPYEVVSDGQLLNRADWPELWAYAQMLSPISDADWLADPTKRGQYSLGDGSTTFRVPDRNGVQTGSISALFGRGDGGASSTGGTILDSAAPNITGSFGRLVYASTGTIYEANTGTGAFSAVLSQAKYKRLSEISAADGTAATYPSGFEFFASNSSPVYGRGSTEVRPKAFTGVWVIRASGGFVAANTSWSVINGDATRPADGTTADGGEIISRYNVNGVREAQMSWRIRAQIGAEHYARLNVYNATANRTAVYDFNDLGTFSAENLHSKGAIYSDGNLTIQNQGWPGINFKSNRYNTPATQIGGSTIIEVSGTDGNVSGVNLIRRRGDGNQAGQIIVSFPTTGGAIALQGTSGIEYKKDVTDADAQEAMDRINGQRLVNFVYKDDEQERVRFGVIAEEAELIAPQYIKHNQVSYEDILDEEGNKIGEKTRDRPSVDVNPIVMDLMGCVQALNAKIAALEARIAELESKE
ncbi:L-shaped tail fiber assembly [Escherichia phage DT57C]|uniref:L-shaped tail fiber assembly n=1 Tax=Escherichia phage DT57C TaxID=2681606 RepID=A0A0A7RZ88_9CAUD|nr:tail fiber protein [Escherichia phage DT57C]AJA41628.1 L-shaped tail fiber assembly [Escherichia phage DT57C]8HQZ_d Chain d, L-shaped tail fiber assembly [Escherichia phage DT57C]8HQZ_e Chain e, L-shaped tail fiber assembly [Escherichia phage DT57C]8HQZ_f Chain f, L-shaped tail fiber assembly [Escherichia phage DT57C]